MAEPQITAMRYGDSNGYWDPTAPAVVASFVLGLDVDARSTSLNERMMDVVRPVDMTWDPPKRADITLVDKEHGVAMIVRLGDLVLKLPDRRLSVIKHEVFAPNYVANPSPKPFQAELQDLIKKHGKHVVSDTPDYILAAYLTTTLDAYNRSVSARTNWKK